MRAKMQLENRLFFEAVFSLFISFFTYERRILKKREKERTETNYGYNLK